MSKVNEMIRGVLADTPGLPDQEAAKVVLGKLTKRELLPLVADAVRDLRRRDVRHAEHSASGLLRKVLGRGNPYRPVEPLTTDDAKARVARLLRKAWATGDGRVTEIGKMTLDELYARKALLERQVAGDQRALAIVVEAIEVIEEAGAECLGDLATVEVGA